MTICDLTQFYAAGSGGIKTYLDAKREQLDRHQDIRHVLIVPAARKGVERNGRHITYFVPGVTIPVSPTYRFCFDVPAVREILRREKPDVVELGCPYFFPWVVYSTVPRDRTAVVGFYHTHFPSAYARLLAKRYLPRAGNFAEASAARYASWVYNRCDLTLTTSGQIAGELDRYGISSVAVVRFGVDLEVFHPAQRSSERRRELGLREDDILLVYAGRFDDEKCVSVALQAFTELSASQRYHLLMIGHGPLQEQLVEASRLNSRIHIKNFVFLKSELAHWLASADIYVTAGPWETFGFSVAEAQACGLPVVGVRQGALIERVPDKIGALAAPYDAADFARSIRHVAENGRIGMSVAARRHAEENYEWSSAIDLLLVHYEEILTQKHISSHRLDKTG